MTEDEAKTKACCGPECCGRFTGNTLSTDKGNGDKFHSLDRVCIGSACMAWRLENRRNPAQQIDPRYGFCGLAGPLA